jgi:hypothetical protein
MGMQMITSWGLPSSSALMISISSAASRTTNYNRKPKGYEYS